MLSFLSRPFCQIPLVLIHSSFSAALIALSLSPGLLSDPPGTYSFQLRAALIALSLLVQAFLSLLSLFVQAFLSDPPGSYSLQLLAALIALSLSPGISVRSPWFLFSPSFTAALFALSLSPGLFDRSH